MPTKPEKIRYNSQAPRADGIQLKRVQTLGVSVDKAREQVSELGNAEIVQFIETNPTVSLTIDTNNIGNVDNMALVTDSLLNYTTTDYAINDPRYDGNASGRLRTIRTASVNSANRVITAANILNAYVDLIVPVTEDDTNVTRTVWFHRQAPSGITMSFDVAGNATENYSLQGNNETWFLNGWKNAQLFKFFNHNYATVAGSTVDGWDIQGPNTQTFYCPASAVPVGSSVLAVAIDENIFFKSDGWQFTDAIGVLAGATGQMTGTAGSKFKMTTPESGVLDFSSPWAVHNTRSYVIFSPPNDTFYDAWTNNKVVSTAGSLGALARQYVNVYYWNLDASGEQTHTLAGRTLRVQNVTVEVAPAVEDLFELGNKNAFSVVRNTPIPVNVTMSVIDSDLETWAQMAGLEFSTAKQVRLSDFNTKNQLLVDIFKDEARTSKTATLVVNDMEVTGVGENVGVGGNSTHEYTFLADNFSFSGTGVDPNT